MMKRRWIVRNEMPVDGGGTRKGRVFLEVQVNNGDDYPTVDVSNAEVDRGDAERRYFTMTLPEMRELRAVLGDAITCASRIQLRISFQKAREAEKKKPARKKRAR